MAELDKYLVLLRREFTRSQARLSRAERQRDRLLEENAELRRKLAERAKPAKSARRPSGK